MFIPPTSNHHFNHKKVALIKRPPLVRSNSSLQPKKAKKSVRFCDNESLENVRLFLKTQMPIECRADPECQKKKFVFSIRKTNWKKPTNSAVKLEDVVFDQGCLIGTVQVANLAFEKQIEIRFTLNDWSTIHTVHATYLSPVPHSAGTWDRFQFKINWVHKYHQVLQLAIKYTVNGREFWDNNQDKNYEMHIIPDIQLIMPLSPSASSDEEDLEEINTQPIHIIQKPWSPPLSPTTPVDINPLYQSFYFQNHHKY